MARVHIVYTVGNPEPVEVPFTAEEEAAADAAEATPVRRLVPKSTITARLIDAGKIAAALTALQSSPAAYARWIAADQPAVYADDADTLALLAAIGADAETILAP
jgi:hypothetical protein